MRFGTLTRSKTRVAELHAEGTRCSTAGLGAFAWMRPFAAPPQFEADIEVWFDSSKLRRRVPRTDPFASKCSHCHRSSRCFRLTQTPGDSAPHRRHVRRLNNQNKRIDAEVKDGRLARKQANSLQNEEHQIRSGDPTTTKYDLLHVLPMATPLLAPTRLICRAKSST
jgi:hypothetical protein